MRILWKHPNNMITKIKTIINLFIEKYEDILKCVLLLTFLCLACLAAEQYITALMKLIVSKVFDGLGHGWTILSVCLTNCIAAAIFLKRTRSNELYIQDRYVVTLAFLSFFNLYYRWLDDNFIFWGVSNNGHCIVAVTDMVYAFLAMVIYKKKKCKLHFHKETQQGKMLLDMPIENDEEDFFGYGQMARDLLDDLSVTDVSKHSFSVGVTGQWGIGKSSFLNLLVKEIEKRGDIVVRFYPRSSMSHKAISADFFDALSEGLGKYHTGAWKIVGKYARSIRSLEGEGWLNKLLDAIENLFNEDDKQRLEDVIRGIGKKIFIIIEDMDRLTAKEILEVLKIMDRNGSFVNTFFITAYDKDYTNSVLRHYLGYNEGHVFTDKYFNHEHTLPAHSIITERRFVENYLSKQLTYVEGDAITKDNILNAWRNVYYEVIRSLGVMRHVKRFINILMSRLPNVKNDINLEDFIKLTLIRYKDIDAYYMLSEGDLVIRGGMHGSQDVLYLRTNAEKRLDDRTDKWEDTLKILKELFPMEGSDGSYNLESDYRRIRMLNAFDMYFFDMLKGKLYHKDLSKLIANETEDDAIQLLTSMYEQDASSVVEYLRSRSMERLGTKDMLLRCMALLLALDHISRRNINVEVSFAWFLGLEAQKDAISAGIVKDPDEYRQLISDFIKEHTPTYTIELGGMILQFVDAFVQHPSERLLFKREEYVAMALWAQRCYLNKFGEKDWSLPYAFQLSNIKQSISSQTEVDVCARKELKAFMQQHADYVAKNVVDTIVDKNKKHKNVTLSFNDSFLPYSFFPVEEYTFENWVDECIEDEDAKYVLKTVYRETKNGNYYMIPTAQTEYERGDFASLALTVRQYENGIAENKVMHVISDKVGVDLKTISKESELSINEVREALERLYEKKMIEPFWSTLKEEMEPFKKGDFVRLDENAFALAVDNTFEETNVFEIDSIDDESGSVKLKDVKYSINIDDIEPIPIDGVHDKNIYYDPVIAASIVTPGQPVPVHHRDYSYYMDSFKRSTYEDKTFDVLIKDANCQFVHEVQHYLEEEFSSHDLKINHTYKLAP